MNIANYIEHNFRIACRFKPYSHLPGTKALIPDSSYIVEAFPERLFIHASAFTEIQLIGEALIFSLGPLEQFTVTQDLERGYVTISGKSQKGFCRFHIAALNGSIFLYPEKIPPGVDISCVGKISKSNDHKPQARKLITSRLDIGNSKAQDAELISRRLQAYEIIPFIYALSQAADQNHTPSATALSGPSLLHALETAVCENKNDQIEPLFTALYSSLFESLFNPTLKKRYLGFELPVVRDLRLEPASILKHLGKIVEQMFLQEDSETLHILPSLPNSFNSGRISSLCTQAKDQLFIEWSKGLPRRVILIAASTKKYTIDFGYQVRSFRMKELSSDERGVSFPNNSQLLLSQGKSYFFDNFQK